MGVAILFSGQGGQYPGMLPWLSGSELPAILTLDIALGMPWRDAVKCEGYENRTAQMVLSATQVATWHLLQPDLREIVAIAGYSVGELAAWVAAGVLRGGDICGIASARSRCMDRAAMAHPGSLASFRGLSCSGARQLQDQFGLEEAIRIAPGHLVLGGTHPGLEQALAWAKERGVDCKPIFVGLASHTSAMRGASAGFSEALDDYPFSAARIRLWCNARGGPVFGIQNAKAALIEQLDRTVLWADIMEGIAAARPGCVMEIGPGRALAEIWNQRDTGIPARSVDEFRDLRSASDWVASHA